MSVYLICGLAGEGAVGKRGVFWVDCRCVQFHAGGLVLFVSGLNLLFFMTFDGLGSSVGCFFECLGCGIGGVQTVLPCCGVD